MPSRAETDLNAGFDVLLDLHGEELTFRDSTITALVDRSPSEEVSDRRTPDFSERDRSVVAVRRTDINPLPRSGETATDSFGSGHRVQTVEPRGDVLYLHCKVV